MSQKRRLLLIATLTLLQCIVFAFAVFQTMWLIVARGTVTPELNVILAVGFIITLYNVIWVYRRWRGGK